MEHVEQLKQESNFKDKQIPFYPSSSVVHSKRDEKTVTGDSKVPKSHQLLNNAEMSKLEALNFMRGIMDECTHLGNFTPPVDPSLSIIVSAKHDAYVPREGIKSIGELWKGCEIRYIDAGHITAFLFNQYMFRYVNIFKVFILS